VVVLVQRSMVLYSDLFVLYDLCGIVSSFQLPIVDNVAVAEIPMIIPTSGRTRTLYLDDLADLAERIDGMTDVCNIVRLSY